MKTNTKRKKIIISALLGIVCAILVFSMFDSMDKKLTTQGDYINQQMKTINDLKTNSTQLTNSNQNSKYQYLVAVQNLKKGSTVKDQDVAIDVFASEDSNAIVNMQDVVGKILTADINQGQMILKSSIFGNVISPSNIPVGMRLVTIPVASIQGLASYIKTGSRVDIFSVSSDKETGSDLILQNVQIISLEPKSQAAAATTASTKEISALDSSAITLLIPVNSVSKLIESSTKGRIQLLARGIADDEIIRHYSPRRTFTSNKPVIKSTLPDITTIPTNELPNPATPPIKRNSAKVEMIQASAKSEVTFE